MNSIPTTGVVTKQASIEVNSDIQTTFNYVTDPKSLPEFLKKHGPIHAISKSEMIKGSWGTPGAARILTFDSGDTLVETLLSMDPPKYFSYSIGEFSNFAKHLTKIGYGEWWFEEKNGSTMVTWKYSFLPKNGFTRGVLTLFTGLFYKAYMQQGLALIKERVEKSKARSLTD